MKKSYLIILSLFSFLSCYSQNNVKVVNEFIEFYNNKDSLKTLNILHKDFVELWKKDTVIQNKTSYSKHYSWGKVMHDLEEIKVIKTDSNFIETISTYYSDRDKLLKISPYKSKRIYEIKDRKIIKIVGGEFDGYKAYEKPRRAQYALFFKWLSNNHNLNPSDFPFNKNGAEELKSLLIAYLKN